MATLQEKASKGRAYLQARIEQTTDAQESAELLAALSSGDRALAVIGDGVLKQEEFSRLADEARKAADGAALWHTKLDTWWKERQDELAQGREALTTLDRMRNATPGRGGVDADGFDADGNPTRQPIASPVSPALDQKQIETLVQRGVAAAGSQFMQLNQFISALTAAHHKEFGELLDGAELTAFCQKHGLDYRQGYDAFVRDRRADRTENKRKEEIAAAERRGREKALSELHGAPPPYSGLGPGPVLADHLQSALTKPSERPHDRGVNAAVAAYLRGELRESKSA